MLPLKLGAALFSDLGIFLVVFRLLETVEISS